MIAPPSNLLVEIPTPEYVGDSFEYNYDYIDLMWGALDSCNANINSIKQYVDDSKKEAP